MEQRFLRVSAQADMTGVEKPSNILVLARRGEKLFKIPVFS
jgi:hypothetical protein